MTFISVRVKAVSLTRQNAFCKILRGFKGKKNAFCLKSISSYSFDLIFFKLGKNEQLMKGQNLLEAEL